MKREDLTRVTHIGTAPMKTHPEDLSAKATTEIIKTADARRAIVNGAGKQPKKKQYRKISKEVRSFSKMLKKTCS